VEQGLGDLRTRVERKGFRRWEKPDRVYDMVMVRVVWMVDAKEKEDSRTARTATKPFSRMDRSNDHII